MRARRDWLLLASVLALVAAAPLLAPYDPQQLLDPVHLKSQPMSWAHWMGTDPLSRDILSRLLIGARTSLTVAVASASLAALIGSAVGLMSGYRGGLTDRVSMRLVDVLLAVPRVLLLLTVVGAWGAPSLTALVVVLGTTGWMGLARFVRNEVRSLRARDHVMASRAVGQGTMGILRHHLMPMLWPQLRVWVTSAIGQLLLLESGLTFLGAGVKAPLVSWGTVILDVSDVVGSARWLVLGPGLVLVVAVLAVYRMGDRFTEPTRPVYLSSEDPALA